MIGVLFALTYRSFARRVGAVALALGFLAIWLVLAVIFVANEPVGAYIFEWPLLAGSLGWLIVLQRPSEPRSLVLIVPAALAVFLFGPELLLSYLGGGVANLPELMLVVAPIAGLLAAAVATDASALGRPT